MKRFRNILVAVGDHDPRDNIALQNATRLAEANGAKLTLMAVVESLRVSSGIYRGIISSDELTRLLVEEQKAKLGQMAEAIPNTVRVETLVTVGRDFIEYIRQILLCKHDLIVKLSQHPGKSFDSTDFHLMRKSPAPVWLIKPQQEQKAPKILAAIDLEQEAYAEGQELNTKILQLATTLAKSEKTDVQVVSCWSLAAESSLRYSAFLRVSEEQLENILREEAQTRQDLLDGLVARFVGTNVTGHLIKGDPKTCLPEYCNEGDFNVMVMGTVARTGISGFMIGNTAETVLGKIQSSVLTVKPEGFVSPVSMNGSDS